MELFQVLLPVIQVICLIAFRRADIFMPGHVLNLSQVVVFQPVDNHALTNLRGIHDIGVDLFYIPEQV